MSDFTVGQRVKFNYDELDSTKLRVIAPAKYGTITQIDKPHHYFVRPDGDKFSITIDEHEITQVQP